MIELKNSIFFDIPKTGGSWVSEGLVQYMDGNFISGTSHQPPTGKEKKFTFTFIRYPVDWYKSYYASRVDQKIMPAHQFEQFIEKMYAGEKVFGRKWTSLSDFFEPYLKCDFVGKTESLGKDLIKALDIAKESRDKGNLLDRPKVNQSQYIPGVSDKIQRKIIQMEQRIIKKYYE